MTAPNPQPQSHNQPTVSDSLNVDLLIVEGNEDTTVRPTRPEILEWRKRKEMEQKQREIERNQPKPDASDGTNPDAK